MLQAVRDGATFADARDAHFAQLADRDRRLAHELAAGVLRHRVELDRLLPLKRADRRLHDVLRLGAYQLRRLTKVPAHAAVSTSVDLARETAGEGGARYVNHVLRRLALGADGVKQGDDHAATSSHPAWLVRRWRERLGEDETARLAAWNDARPAIVLQPARWSAEVLRERLAAAGVVSEPAPFGAGLRLVAGSAGARFPPPRSLPGYHEGGFVVQDPAAALVCRFAAIPPGALVYDACAAPGGKAVALEKLGARVVAGDARRARLERLHGTARRAGVAIRVVGADLLAAPFAPGAFEAVLVDAPCTATGTMARHPDARWRLSPGAAVGAAARQASLLGAAAALVRVGGLLVYATCSLEPEENDDVVNAFVRRHAEFAREPPSQVVPPELLTATGDLQTWPQRHGIDGAYAARLRRERR